ncbi:MAG: NfeD family protein [Candidatus Contendobacter sp.]|jgi:membrane protein implicated in regulation of membrane protease activity|nr:NfeD family protein [Gammaproteobacteria bacterium]MCC8994109.1 NfeD family protein [Candidatus Contendobacter sp.]
MTAWLLEPAYWNWWLLGVALMAIEAIAPGFFFLWMGVAALLVGLLLTLLPMAWTYQVLLFAVLSVGSIVAWRLRLRRHPTQTQDSLLNRRGHQYVGRVFTLEAPVVNGYGKIRVDDSTWKVAVNQDCPAGARLRIVGADGVILKGIVEG